MQVYNSLTNKIEEFKPIKENTINMYVCGPTVNKNTHIGHMFPAIFFDVVYRYFKYLGYNVTYASNFTDVDDKIIAAAKEEGIKEEEVANKYIKMYLEDLKKLNCLEIDYRPRVTESITDIINFISLLIEKDFAYKKGKDVYFRVDKVKDYGTLSNQRLEELNHGNRINVDDNKENPYDFVLWKYTEDGIKWDAPFGRGRPGWHTECVVMINKIFGGKIDIHGGGIDLKFPHHENEIAQSCLAWDHKLANYWMHNGHIMVNGEKMSKSLNNSIYVKDLLESYDVNVIRLAILKSNYRLPLNFDSSLFEEATSLNEKISNALKQANLHMNLEGLSIKNDIKSLEMEKWMDDDFNTPNVITYLLELIKELNQDLRKDKEKVVDLTSEIIVITNILGLGYPLEKISTEDLEIYNNWINARNNKDFEAADRYRRELITKNII